MSKSQMYDQRGHDLSKIKDFEAGGFIRTWSVHIPEETAEEVKKTLDSKWLNTGKKEVEFRSKIREHFNAPYAVACNSGTSALKAALTVIGVKPGDEVVSTPYTFIATNTSILEVGATPVFADIDYDTLNITAKEIERKITPKTKAVIVVHYGGLPAELDEIREVCKKYDLPLIEDSAHAMGSMYKGKMIGEIGDYVTFSFQVVKIVTCGDGGVICTDNPENYEKLKRTIWYGIDRETKRADPLDPLPEDITELGFKMNMNDITATIACVAMDNLDEKLKDRREIGMAYRNFLSDFQRIKLLKFPDHSKPNYQIFPVHVDDREAFSKFMFDKGIQVNVNNRRNDKYTIFGGLREDLPNTARADEDVILLPCHTDISNTDLQRIFDALREYETGESSYMCVECGSIDTYHEVKEGRGLAPKGYVPNYVRGRISWKGLWNYYTCLDCGREYKELRK